MCHVLMTPLLGSAFAHPGDMDISELFIGLPEAEASGAGDGPVRRSEGGARGGAKGGGGRA